MVASEEPSQRTKQRDATVQEIITTERAYVADLALMTVMYKPSLASAFGGAPQDFRGRRGLSTGDHDVLFHPSLVSLVTLHTDLLRQLEAAEADADSVNSAASVGKALAKIVPYLRL